MKYLITAFVFTFLVGRSLAQDVSTDHDMMDNSTDHDMMDNITMVEDCDMSCDGDEGSRRVWLCEVVNWRCHQRKWQYTFHEWWMESCEESSEHSLEMPEQECPDTSMFQCKCGEAECFHDSNMCEFCYCNGSYKYSGRFLDFWKSEKERFKKLNEIYNTYTQMCTARTSDEECNSTSTMPPPPV